MMMASICGDFRVGAGGAKAGGLGLDDLGGGNADDVGAAGVERLDLAGIDVKAGDAEALLAEEQGERQADVSHADDADAGLAGGNAGFEFGGKRDGKRHEADSNEKSYGLIVTKRRGED